MDRTAPAAHSRHDELLIARLYGGDVGERERARAQAQMADCEECAALFVDLGAIARATAAMPVPPRPRDFRLSQEDAARLSRKRRVWPAVFGAGLRRSLGGSLAALGLVGVVLMGTLSLFGGSSATQGALTTEDRAAANEGAGGYAASQAAPMAAASPRPAASAAATRAAAHQDESTAPVSVGTSSDAAESPGPPSASLPPELAAATQAPGGANSSGGEAQSKGVPPAQATPGGVDARLVWLIGFGALFVIGLALVLLPRLRRLRSRGRGTRT
jgi:hypothetical protein